MNTQCTKYLSRNLILMTWLTLIIGLSSCIGNSSSFNYLVKVQAKDSGIELVGAQVRIEVASIAPLYAFTDTEGIARIFIDSSRENKPALLIVEASGYKKYVLNIDLRTDVLPATIQLVSDQDSWKPALTITQTHPTFEPTNTSLPPNSASCSWILYLNGISAPSLRDENCLSDVKVKGIGVSGDAKQISFFVDRSPTGKFGVCRDISDRNDLNFTMSLRNNITSARFLVAVGPDPVPGKSAYAFRIQPESISNEMYIKFIKYTLDYPKYFVN